MATVQDLKRRIRSVRNTRKITRAMELVAAAKLRRAEQRITAMRPYAETMNELIAGVGRAASSVRLPLLEQRENVETVAIVPLTGDRGLAGSFNAQVVRRAFALERSLDGEGKAVRWVAVGKKGRSTLAFRRRELAGAFTGFTDRPEYADAQAIAHRVSELFTEGEVDRVVLVYNTYVSALTQRVTEQDLLPISAEVLTSGRGGAGRRRAPRRLHLRAGARGDPRAPASRLPGDADLPRAPRVDGVRAGRAHDGDAERVEERRRADRLAHAADEPRAPGRDHPGDPRGRRRRRGFDVGEPMVPLRDPSFLPCTRQPSLASRRAEPASGSGTAAPGQRR